MGLSMQAPHIERVKHGNDPYEICAEIDMIIPTEKYGEPPALVEKWVDRFKNMKIDIDHLDGPENVIGRITEAQWNPEKKAIVGKWGLYNYRQDLLPVIEKGLSMSPTYDYIMDSFSKVITGVDPDRVALCINSIPDDPQCKTGVITINHAKLQPERGAGMPETVNIPKEEYDKLIIMKSKHSEVIEENNTLKKDMATKDTTIADQDKKIKGMEADVNAGKDAIKTLEELKQDAAVFEACRNLGIDPDDEKQAAEVQKVRAALKEGKEAELYKNAFKTAHSKMNGTGGGVGGSEFPGSTAATINAPGRSYHGKTIESMSYGEYVTYVADCRKKGIVPEKKA